MRNPFTTDKETLVGGKSKAAENWKKVKFDARPSDDLPLWEMITKEADAIAMLAAAGAYLDLGSAANKGTALHSYLLDAANVYNRKAKVLAEEVGRLLDEIK